MEEALLQFAKLFLPHDKTIGRCGHVDITYSDKVWRYFRSEVKPLIEEDSVSVDIGD